MPKTIKKIESLTVRECVERMRAGTLTAVELVKFHLGTTQTSEADLGAWAYLNESVALAQARELDQLKCHGNPIGALHGIPIGIKDIFDTLDMPTERGTQIHAGRQAVSDSAVVDKLKDAGAVIMGKTVTTEYAYIAPSKTRNPHNTKFSPGGSSSGSAAAVAAGHIPLAIGSQTNGSVNRPASFCGIFGFKPSRGFVSRQGALETSNTLDHVGVFSRDLGDLALLTDVLGGYDPRDPASFESPRPCLLDAYESRLSSQPKIAWIDMPYASRFTEDAAASFELLLDHFGTHVVRIQAPESLSALLDCHKIIYDYEIVRSLRKEYANKWDQLSDTIKPALERAATIPPALYQKAQLTRQAAEQWFSRFFTHYDAILTPSAIGEAPLMGNSTGDPVCCTIWTLCGLPCLNLPVLSGDNDMPIGVQLVGACGQDDTLFQIARQSLEQLQTLNQYR